MLAPLRMAEWGFADHFGQGLGQLLRLNISEKMSKLPFYQPHRK